MSRVPCKSKHERIGKVWTNEPTKANSYIKIRFYTILIVPQKKIVKDEYKKIVKDEYKKIAKDEYKKIVNDEYNVTNMWA